MIDAEPRLSKKEAIALSIEHSVANIEDAIKDAALAQARLYSNRYYGVELEGDYDKTEAMVRTITNGIIAQFNKQKGT